MASPIQLSGNLQMFAASGRRIAINVLWNLLGQAAPMAAAVLSLPILISALGTDRFGVLALAWAVVGYFSLFDLGLGRALTQIVAEKLGAAQEEEIPALIWTGLAVMLIPGLMGTMLLALLSPWLVYGVLKIPRQLQAETLSSFYLLAFTIPFVISSAGLRGVLEAYQRFDLVTAVRIPLGIFQFLGPLMVVPFSLGLMTVTSTLVFIRLVGWLAHLMLCLHTVPTLRARITLRGPLLHPLVTFGTWMTVSNIISPLMVTLDRLLIGSLLSVSAVAYYATPYELVTRLWIISGALVGVLFPSFSSSFLQDPARTARLFDRGVKYVFLALFPVILLAVSFSREGLALWLGPDLSSRSASVLQWLATGVFINSLAQVAFALVQGVGRPDLTAKLHLLELPFYIVAAWWLITTRGIEGAALAWFARMSLDAALLFTTAWKILPTARNIIADMWYIIYSLFLILIIIALPLQLTVRFILVSAYILIHIAMILSTLREDLMM
ncbi:MAG: flippase [Chloroflexota bacterium]